MFDLRRGLQVRLDNHAAHRPAGPPAGSTTFRDPVWIKRLGQRKAQLSRLNGLKPRPAEWRSLPAVPETET